MNVVTTMEGKCKGCYACVRNCPVKAIKVEGGQATVMEDLCIACGYCVRVCAQHAKHIREDLPKVREALAGSLGARGDSCGAHGAVYAMLAPSFVVEFSCEFRPGQLVSALRELGFAGVYEVAWGAERVTQEYLRVIGKRHPNGMISTPCPAIVNLVEARYPELVSRLAPVVSPMVAAGRMIKKEHPGAYTVFIGPCVAKKSEILDREVTDAVDAVLTFAELRILLDDLQAKVDTLPEGPFDQPIAHLGRLYPVSGGLLRSAALQADMLENDIIVVEGKDNCIEFLEALKRGRECPEFVDMLFCEGCINGPIITSRLLGYGRRRVAVDFAKASRGAELSRDRIPAIMSEQPAFPEIEARRGFRRKDAPMPAPTEEDIGRILRELDKTKPEDELNCGACGYNTCREKAVAVFRGLAENKMCLPYLITQLEVHNRQLAELKAYHEDIIQSITEGIVVVDRDMRVTSFNDAGERVSRQAPGGAIGKKVFEVLPPLDTPVCRHAFERAITWGRPTEIGEVIYKLDNERVIVNLKVSALKNDSGDVYGAVLLSQDITERRRLETQLIQSDRLASLGQLAAGVAHEINTPLTLISGYTEVLSDTIGRDGASLAYLKTIAEEADRIAEIVRSLLNFARPNAVRAGRCKVNEAVERILKIFGGQMLHKGIEVRLDLGEDDPEAEIDTGELQQVLLNMVLNAIQAMPRGGSLEILTGAASKKSARTAANEEHPEDGEERGNEGSPRAAGEEREARLDDSQRCASMDTVEIVVRDTGCGIPPENISKIFDPFFTTKEVGKGTGLGLAVSFGIAEKHGGSIRVESGVGKGTTFTITLPSCGKEA